MLLLSLTDDLEFCAFMIGTKTRRVLTRFTRHGTAVSTPKFNGIQAQIQAQSYSSEQMCLEAQSRSPSRQEH